MCRIALLTMETKKSNNDDDNNNTDNHAFGAWQGAYLVPDAAVFGPGPYPTIVSTYGGPHVQTVSNSWGVTADLRSQFLRAQAMPRMPRMPRMRLICRHRKDYLQILVLSCQAVQRMQRMLRMLLTFRHHKDCQSDTDTPGGDAGNAADNRCVRTARAMAALQYMMPEGRPQLLPPSLPPPQPRPPPALLVCSPRPSSARGSDPSPSDVWRALHSTAFHC